MEKTQRIILGLIAIVGITLFSACNSNDSKQHQKPNIHLNNGQKWKVNKEMQPAINKGNELVNQFIAQNDTNYKVLAKELKAQNNTLIQECTMTGESHNVLHHWLHPYMEQVDKLAKAKNYKDAKELLPQLEQSFKTYHTYFK